jgi:hypothetical protein
LVEESSPLCWSGLSSVTNFDRRPSLLSTQAQRVNWRFFDSYNCAHFGNDPGRRDKLEIHTCLYSCHSEEAAAPRALFRQTPSNQRRAEREQTFPLHENDSGLTLADSSFV